MKRIFVLLTILLLPLAACSAGSDAQSAAPTLFAAPTPSPAPEEPRTIAVFGAEDAQTFLEGIRSAAAGAGVEIVSIDGGPNALAAYRPEGEAAAIVYLADAADTLPQASIPFYVFAAAGQSVPAGTPHLTYAAGDAPQLALDAALSYPPHLAPVRMIGLFSAEDSAAYAVWAAAKANADVFAKQEYFASTAETALADWLTETLTRYYPGMLDAIYAESGALAVAAADTLASLGRDDLEVFSAASDAGAAGKLSPILLCAAGANEADAGARCYVEAVKLLSGGTAENGTLSPTLSWYPENP